MRIPYGFLCGIQFCHPYRQLRRSAPSLCKMRKRSAIHEQHTIPATPAICAAPPNHPTIRQSNNRPIRTIEQFPNPSSVVKDQLQPNSFFALTHSPPARSTHLSTFPFHGVRPHHDSDPITIQTPSRFSRPTSRRRCGRSRCGWACRRPRDSRPDPRISARRRTSPCCRSRTSTCYQHAP